MSTIGLQLSDRELQQLLIEAGQSAYLIAPAAAERKIPAIIRRGQELPGVGVLLDLSQSWALRRAVRADQGRPDAYIFTTTGGTFLAPRSVLSRAALRFDALSCENRPGRLGAILRWRERRSLARVRVLIPMSSRRDAAPTRAAFLDRAEAVVVVPPPISDAPASTAAGREPGLVLSYAGSPHKKGLDLIIRAWNSHPDPAARLLVTGIEPEPARAFLSERGLTADHRVEFTGRLPQPAFLQLLDRAEVYLAASRYEDFGSAQLEALNHGCLVASTRSEGPFEAGLVLARVDENLLADKADPAGLARALGYAAGLAPSTRQELTDRIGQQLQPYRRTAVAQVVRQELVPALARLPHLATP